MPGADRARYRIEPFDQDRHDRSAFSCGIDQVDNYFRKTANKLFKANNIRLYVMVSPEGDVAGFYSINAHSVHYEDLPKRFARTRPSHGQIPAAFISMIGRDLRYRGEGIGDLLLADALMRIARASQSVGIAVVKLDVLDCGDPVRTERRKALYAKYGFQPLQDHPLRMFLPLATVRELLREGEQADDTAG